MVTSVKEFFDTRVPDALTRHPARAKEVAATFLFKISGPDGGTWTADLVTEPPTCLSGSFGAPQCTIEATDDDFRAVIDGGVQAAMQVFFTGRLKLSGDSSLITRLSRILQMGQHPEMP
jgi:putative sterol carrier protein